MNIDGILKYKWAQSRQLNINEYRYSYFNKYYSGMTKEAIKEIVETTVKMCAENAEAGVIYDAGDYGYPSAEIDKDSILNTINQITF